MCGCNRPCLLLGIAALLAWNPTTSAQTTAAQLTGRITDPSGAVVQGATIKATNEATEVSRETGSNESGNYTVPLLEPGVYRITVQKEGFHVAQRQGVTLHVNAVVRLDFVMLLGAVTEAISVKADDSFHQRKRGGYDAVQKRFHIAFHRPFHRCGLPDYGRYSGSRSADGSEIQRDKPVCDVRDCSIPRDEEIHSRALAILRQGMADPTVFCVYSRQGNPSDCCW